MQLLTFSPLGVSITDFSFSSDGSLLASASVPETWVEIWDAETGERLLSLNDPYNLGGASIIALTFINDTLLAYSTRDVIRLLEVREQ
jgi:WD40 repeat protein